MLGKFRALMLLAALWIQPCRAFINIESVRREAGAGFVGKSSLKFSGQSGNTDKFMSEFSSLNLYRHETNEILFLGDFAYSLTSGDVDTNHGRLHVRDTIHPERQSSLETFVQSEWDEFRQLKTRDLTGLNLRQRLSEVEKESLFLGIGSFYEYSLYSDGHHTRGPRGNFYLSYVNGIRDRTSGYVTFYYQPAWWALADLRLQLQSGMQVTVTSRVSLNLEFNLTTETVHPDGVKPTDSNYLAGFTLKY